MNDRLETGIRAALALLYLASLVALVWVMIGAPT